jgi:hypothetical protein
MSLIEIPGATSWYGDTGSVGVPVVFVQPVAARPAGSGRTPGIGRCSTSWTELSACCGQAMTSEVMADAPVAR